MTGANMTTIAAPILITLSSVLLFGYWFRYSCLLIVSARTARNFAAEVAMANQLAFLEVQSRLRQRAVTDLDRLRDLLDRDYAVLSYLLKHTANPSMRESALETGMLAINYRLMRGWYGLSRGFSAGAAYRALDEMSMVVAHFANAMGERTAQAAA